MLGMEKGSFYVMYCSSSYYIQDGSKYEGYFNQGFAHGRGRLVHSNGEVYEGKWHMDQAQGLGVYVHQDGAIYEGHWEKDL